MTYYAGYIRGQCDSTAIAFVYDQARPKAFTSLYAAMAAACISVDDEKNASCPVVFKYNEDTKKFEVAFHMVLASPEAAYDLRLKELIRDGVPARFYVEVKETSWKAPPAV